MQPVVVDSEGVLRFKKNEIVEFLYEYARERGISLNVLASLPFADEDRRQLAQLLGYSVDGYCDLPYVDKAEAMRAMSAARAGGLGGEKTPGN